MYFKNDRLVAEGEYGTPDAWRVEVHCSAGNTDAEIIAYVECFAFCHAGGARIVSRCNEYAEVQYYA